MISVLQGKNGEKLGEGVFAAKHFDRGEHLDLFAFGKLTSKAAYEVPHTAYDCNSEKGSCRQMYR